jgi:hypothetical protein
MNVHQLRRLERLESSVCPVTRYVIVERLEDGAAAIDRQRLNHPESAGANFIVIATGIRSSPGDG